MATPRRVRAGLYARHPLVAIRRGATAAVLIGTVVATGAVSNGRHAAADDITDKIGVVQQQLATDGTTMDHLRAELAAAADQEDALQKAIADLDKQIAAAEQQVNDAQAQLDAISAALSAAQDDLAATQARLVADRHQLSLEMVVMYKAQNASTGFSNFLNSGDFNSFWQHVVDVNRLNASEQRLVASVTADELRVQAEVERIATQKQQQAALLATLHGIVDQLNGALATRQEAQQQLQALQARDQQRLAEMEAAAAELKAQIADLQAQEAAALAAGGGNGHFQWPMTGDITQGFGCTSYPFEPYNPNCASRHFHSGIDIATSCGTDIAAADSGIAHTYSSGWGFGNHVIIVHGNGWTSIYGHMSGFAVADGQQVGRGQLIGYEGSTGNSTGCHLHFEVDLDNNPQNPLAYLP